MSRPRNPIEVSDATGASGRDKRRHADRTRFTDEENPPLGKPKKGTLHREVAIWESFKSEWPWLRESDRAFVEGLVIMRAKLDTPSECDSKFFKTYFDALKAFGGSPGERTKMPKGAAKAEDDEETDGSEYLN